MNTAFSLPIWVARCRGNKTNCLYPDFHTATDVETLKKLVAKGKADAEEMEKIAQEVADFREVLPMQLYVDDITTEKLVSVISANHGRRHF